MKAILIDLKTVAPFMAVVLIGLLIYLRSRQQRSIDYLLCFSAFYVYLLYVAKYTIFPLRLFDHSYATFMRANGATWVAGINLHPLSELSLYYLYPMQAIGNVLLTVPLGFGLPFVIATDLKSVVWRGFLFSASIELVQLLLDVVYGFPVRVVDVNDVLLNVIGAIVGFSLFHLFTLLYRSTMPHKWALGGAWSHIHATLRR